MLNFSCDYHNISYFGKVLFKYYICFSYLDSFPLNYRTIGSIQFRWSVMSDSLQPHGLQHTRLPRPSPAPRPSQTHVNQSVMPFSHLIFCCPLPLLPAIFPSIRVFSLIGCWHQVAKVLELQLQHQSFQRIFRTDFLSDGLVGSPCSPRDSQVSSPKP